MRSFLTTLGIILLMSNPFTFAQAQDLQADDLRFFRIGTGGVAGTYYPIGGMIAHAISNPPGSRPCAVAVPRDWSSSRNPQMARSQM